MFGFQLMNVLFPIMFVTILGIFIFILIRNLVQWNKNNHSPKLTVEATVVTKRRDYHHRNSGNMEMTMSNTSYYVTFQVQSGDRMELRVNGSEYGMLAEGDRGQLTFQGTRYLDFQRA